MAKNSAGHSPLAAAPRILLAGLSLVCGCSIVYDGDVFLPQEPPPPNACEDAPEGELTLGEITPGEVYEGQGCLPDGDACDATARPVPLVIRGCHIAADAVITLEGASFGAQPVGLAVSADGQLAAFAVHVPIDDSAADGREPVMVRVAQDGAVQTIGFDVVRLPELGVDDDEPLPPTDSLAALYSRVEIRGQPKILAGEVAARLRATSAIVLATTLDARGLSGEQAGVPGPGGYPGSAATAAGERESGGEAGTSDTGGLLQDGNGGGGGGGGHGLSGQRGAGGDLGGAGGEVFGDAFIAPLTGGHGGGGGGHGKGGLVEPVAEGGHGGGGGGIVELTSHGEMRFEADAAIRVDGGDGEPGATASGCGGGGGGGSGGAILVRAAYSIDAQQAAGGWLSAAGGTGSSPGGDCNAGGRGGGGRVRMDIPASGTSLPPASQEFVAYRGPMIDPSLAAITADAEPPVGVYGSAGETYWIERLGGQPAVELPRIVGDERVEATLELAPGLNEVCVLVSTSANVGEPEGLNCVSIAYIPQ